MKARAFFVLAVRKCTGFLFAVFQSNCKRVFISYSCMNIYASSVWVYECIQYTDIPDFMNTIYLLKIYLSLHKIKL